MLLTQDRIPGLELLGFLLQVILEVVQLEPGPFPDIGLSDRDEEEPEEILFICPKSGI